MYVKSVAVIMAMNGLAQDEIHTQNAAVWQAWYIEYEFTLKRECKFQAASGDTM
jgi:hypothetical protein